MATTALPAITGALATGMGGLAGMAATQVSASSWSIATKDISCFVAPAFSGSQTVATMDDGYDLIDRVLLEFTFRPLPNLEALYTNAAAMLERVRAWLRANDTLGGIVNTCHAEPLTWQATETRTPESEIVNKQLTFTVAAGHYADD